MVQIVYALAPRVDSQGKTEDGHQTHWDSSYYLKSKYNNVHMQSTLRTGLDPQW